MEKLCDDLSSQILIRLPVEDLVQLRRVCKRWNALLREPSFTKSHLRRSINNNDKDEFFIVFIRGIPFKGHSTTASPDIKLVNPIKFPVNFPSQEAQLEKINVIGAVNGLICFSVDFDVIHLWNPTLSALFTVPPYAIPVPSCRPYVKKIDEYIYNFRFGFDPKNDDYKIVKVVRPKQSRKWLQVEVYSMKLGCWKLITQGPPSPVSMFYNHENMFISADGQDGYLHWLCYCRNLKVKTIVAFDLAAESFSEISFPYLINFNYHDVLRLGFFGGKLCVISRSGNRYSGYSCEVWVKDQYGCWVKNGFSHLHKPVGILHPYGFTLKNNFIYHDHKYVLYLYDPDAPVNKIKPFLEDKSKCRAYQFDGIIQYVESLVWVTPPAC